MAAIVESITRGGPRGGPAILLALQLALVGDRLARGEQHLELDRLVTFGADLDAVSAGVDPELLEQPVEVVHVADEVAVDEHLRLARLDLQSQRAGGAASIVAAPTAAGISAAAVAAVAVASTAAVAVAPRA